jgi:hypothetical protein
MASGVATRMTRPIGPSASVRARTSGWRQSLKVSSTNRCGARIATAVKPTAHKLSALRDGCEVDLGRIRAVIESGGPVVLEK